MSDEERLRNALDDPDAQPITPEMWTKAKPFIPRKKDIHIKLDEEVVDYFKQINDGKRGYQTLINSVLRQYVEHHRAAK
ncbi:MAG: BrnA antitoxin family protein [Desulfovibrionaceae bacterium]|nr:BrnA antitoxin family protein [Desulfovibrionaceae bacterium]MBF0514395.1 BrnA antitoxin family protein [Desulfovibrionaceae bacterium]